MNADTRTASGASCWLVALALAGCSAAVGSEDAHHPSPPSDCQPTTQERDPCSEPTGTICSPRSACVACPGGGGTHVSIALDFVCRSGRWVSFDYLLDCNGAHGATVYADSACQVPFAPPDAAPPDAAPPDATPPDAAPPATCVQGGACSREGGVCATAESYCVQCSAMRWIYGPRNFTCSGGHWNEIQVDCNPWAPGGYVDPACTVPASSGVDDGGVVDAGVADGG